MTMNAADLACLEDVFSTEAPPDWLARLRRELPGRSITVCDAADMTEGRPYRAYPEFEVYLVDGSGHCWQLTQDPAVATALVVAQRRRRAAS
jgi:hypothetical protein